MFKFGNLDSFKNDVGRNTFDMSFGTNATFKIGKLYPVFCKEVLPRDTWKIDPKVAIQMMPTVFPLKTRLRCFVHFYYVKNRTLWKDWQKFINNSYGLGNENYNIVPPYIQHDYDKNLHGTGSLADFLGWPTALPKPNYDVSISSTRSSNGAQGYVLNLSQVLSDPRFSVEEYQKYVTIDPIIGEYLDLSSFFAGSNYYKSYVISLTDLVNDQMFFAADATISYKTAETGTPAYGCSIVALDNDDVCLAYTRVESVKESGGFERAILTNIPKSCTKLIISWRDMFNTLELNNSLVQINNGVFSTSDLYDFDSDWWTGMNISALPFRAYESIYNAYYRNWQADPLIDSQNRPNYDTYVRNVEGGADSLDYDLYLRNYEKDMFTSAHPTPQMGVAPLVGITTLGEATFNYNGTDYTAQATFADDNETIKDFHVSANTPAAVGASATALTGISINDLRSVNALQRYLENGVRASYKYRNQIAAHFGSAPEFDAVDMPMFIGGIATDLGQNVTSTTGDYTDSAGNSVPAGTPISNGYFAYDGNDTIEKYCDEHGFIMGILSIVPIPNYPQGLSPMWRKEDYMRYFTPEMGHLGYQPIKSNEIALFRQLDDKTGQVIPDSEVFGYQRSWYEYCGSNDEVHGEFRTTMRDFMLSRWFSDVPKLDPEFIGVDSSKLSYIFADTNDNDKFIGQLYFSAFAKRPIPEYGTPKLD